jgi:hypothetical protein
LNGILQIKDQNAGSEDDCSLQRLILLKMKNTYIHNFILFLILFPFSSVSAQTTFTDDELRPETRVATTFKDWAPIWNKNPDGEPLLKHYYFSKGHDSIWGNFYEECFGEVLYHPQHIVRLPNKKDDNGNLRAYFVVSQSRGHNGYISVLETKPGAVDTSTDEIQTTNNSIAGNIIWQDIYTGSFNGTYNPVGNWNHPGKMDVCGGVLVVAMENWESDFTTFCGDQRGSSYDALVFYDVRDPKEPKYIGKMTSTEMGLGAISSVFLKRMQNGDFILNVGNSKDGVTVAKLYRAKNKKLGFTINDWTDIGNPLLTGQHGAEFRAFAHDRSGKEQLVSFDSKNAKGILFSVWEYDTTNQSFASNSADSKFFYTGDLPAGSSEKDWDADGLYVSEKGLPIIYTVRSYDGGTNYAIYQLTTYNDDSNKAIPKVEWARTYGSNNYDFGYSIKPTKDGGYIMAGSASDNNGDVSGVYGYQDYWVVKLDDKGDIEWQNAIGGASTDEALSIIETSTGDFVGLGYTQSNNGDVSGFHGWNDYWIFRMDSTGKLKNSKALGGNGNDVGRCVIEDSDGNFILVGSASSSSNGDVPSTNGAMDYWVVKMDANFNIIKSKTIGKTYDDDALSLQQTSDGGYIVVGRTALASGGYAGHDYGVIKFDNDLDIEWQKSLGGDDNDYANSVCETSDGGFVIAGQSASNNGQVKNAHGGWDCWIVKLSSNGSILWENALGGSGDDIANSIQETTDGGLIVLGASAVANGDVTTNYGAYDYWVFKLSSTGSLLWEKTMGGRYKDVGREIHKTEDGGYILTGHSESDDYFLENAHGLADHWIVKLTFPPVAVFDNDKDTIAINECVNYSDSSTYGPETWKWTFEGGTPSSSTLEDPKNICYKTAGEYKTTLVVTNPVGTSSVVRTILVKDFANLPEHSSNAFSMYPNPTQNNFTIQLTKEGSGTVCVYDLAGKEILKKPLLGEKSTIDLSKEVNGIYIVTVSTEYGTFTQKLIKQ